jgi:prolyl-tRNA editing enzyme YbaK/EbsC (Cys-tRNA(Pro) deacylase)
MTADQVLQPGDLEVFIHENDIPGEMLALEVPTPTVEEAAQAVGTSPDNIVKSILFRINEGYVLAITCGPAHIERRAIAAHYKVGRKKVKLTDPGRVLLETGYEVGAMPPFGHHTPLPTLIDKRVLEKDEIYAGGGSDQTLIRIEPAAILAATQAEVLDLLHPPKPASEGSKR